MQQTSIVSFFYSKFFLASLLLIIGLASLNYIFVSQKGHYGCFGKITAKQEGALSLIEDDGEKESVLIGPGAQIVKGRNQIKLSDLKIDDRIIVVGEPAGDGAMTAKFIRVLAVAQ